MNINLANIDFAPGQGGGGSSKAVWGSITGVLSDQTDLMTYMSSFATMSWVDAQGYLTEHQSLEGYATESWVSSQNYLTATSLTGYATEQWVGQQGYITSSVLSGYATESWVSSQGYITSSALSEYATLDELETVDNTTAWLTEEFASLASRVSALETNYGDAITITNNILGV